MDIELLSKMVKELILDNDRVSLPGVGAFVAETVPSTFSDRGYTINPPYRRLSFRQGKSQDTDTLLVELYASANKVDTSIASKVITEFVNGMVEELRQRKTIVFPDLGRLRATRENNFFFIPDENLDIFPEGVGLEPISLKSHTKPTSFDFTELDVAMAPAADTVEDAAVDVVALPESTSDSQPAEDCCEEQTPMPEPEPVPEPEPTVPQDADEKLRSHEALFGIASDDEAAETGTSIWKRWWFIMLMVIAGLALLVGLAYGIFMYFVHNSPDLIDRMLYTQEEIEILNHYKN